MGNLRARRLGHACVALAMISVLLAAVVAVDGPSLVALNLGPRDPWFPPFYRAQASMPTWFGIIGCWLSVITGAVSLGLGLRALERGWRPSIRRLIGLGLGLNLVPLLVPPLTSGDVLMYAAYGRVTAQGQDAYSMTPADIFRQQYDPLLRWTERPWQDTPSVYGPLASLSQVVANWLGGDSMHRVVFFLQVFNIGALIALGLGCIAIARRSHVAVDRAALLTLCNPLLIWSVAVGAHNEALGVAFAIAGLTQMRRNSFLAGLFVGLAGCVKVSTVFYGLGMVWAYRRSPRQLVQLCAGALVPIALGYGLWNPHALFAAARNSGYIFLGGWAHVPEVLLRWTIGHDLTQTIIKIVGVVALIPAVAMLNRVLPWRPIARIRRGSDPRRDPLTVAARASTVVVVAWLVVSPWTLPWYDLMAWAPLALLGASAMDWILLLRGVFMCLSMVIARPMPMSDAVHFARDAMLWLSAGVQWIVLALIVRWWWLRRSQVTNERVIAVPTTSARDA